VLWLQDADLFRQQDTFAAQSFNHRGSTAESGKPQIGFGRFRQVSAGFQLLLPFVNFETQHTLIPGKGTTSEEIGNVRKSHLNQFL